MSVVSTDKPRPERLVAARRSLSLTQEEWARKLGCSVFTIGKCERGARSPGAALLRRMSLESGKPIDWFYEDDEVAA